MNKATVFAILFWTFAILVATVGALNIGASDQEISAKDNFPIEMTLLLGIFNLVFGLINGFRMCRAKNEITWFDKTLDRLFGLGFSSELTRKINIALLLPVFFILIGSIGLIKAEIIDSSGAAFHTLFFILCLSTGIGHAVAFLIYWLFGDRKKNALRNAQV